MKFKSMKLLSILLCVALVFGSVGVSFGQQSDSASPPAKAVSAKDTDDGRLEAVVDVLGENIDGERAFDYLSYVFLGWRTTGGHWQNKVISEFIPDQLAEAGYEFAGVGTSPDLATAGTTDQSGVEAEDTTWVTNHTVPETTWTWDPEYARLEVTQAPPVTGRKGLIGRINVESASFDPTSDTYLDYFKDLYGVENLEQMWDWVIKKNSKKERVNVINGEEAKLGKRAHLAWQTSFTDPKGTTPDTAQGVEGEAIYVGAVTGSGANITASVFTEKDMTPAEAQAACAGKVLLSDSTLSTTTALARQSGAVAVMSTNSLSAYNLPEIDGEIPDVFTKSARYAAGTGLSRSRADMAAGAPIVEWQFSQDQKAALKELLQKSDREGPVLIKSVSIGDVYQMNDEMKGGVGQGVAMAEIKGSRYPDERVLICAHVQEPGSNDNATGVGALLEIATEMKRLIDTGKLARPERTLTFLWGDEMNLATIWLNSHPEEKSKLLLALDMDMVGEDPSKTGGPMRIEKTPDPSATYGYTLDTLPGQDPYYDETFKNEDGEFVRLPDSHTLWGAGSTSGLFKAGFFLNDLYMAASKEVIQRVDNKFRVEVCPYEGGSDHTRFLQQNIPALLTWHFTDYTYHSSVDTLAMSSASEMKNVGIVTLATAWLVANTTSYTGNGWESILNIVYEAGLERIAVERQNTANHLTYIKENDGDFDAELDNEVEVLEAWADWYDEALWSVPSTLLEPGEGEPVEIWQISALRSAFNAAIDDARALLQPDLTVSFDSNGGSAVESIIVTRGSAIGELPAPGRSNYRFDGWFNGDEQVTADTPVMESMTLTARWTAYPRITFNATGGSPVGDLFVPPGAPVGNLPPSTRGNFLFMGWYTEEMGGQPVLEGFVVNADITLYARWRPLFTVNFDSMGGTPADSRPVLQGQPIGQLPVPFKPNAMFDGWYTEPFSGQRVDENWPVNNDVTLYARWIEMLEITFDTQGGTPADPRLIFPGNPVGELPLRRKTMPSSKAGTRRKSMVSR